MALYACIQGTFVVNIIEIDNPTDELLQSFIQALSIDQIQEANEFTVVGGTFIDGKFWEIQPFPSWSKNFETNRWDPPTPKPTEPVARGYYVWDEDSLAWVQGSEYWTSQGVFD